MKKKSTGRIIQSVERSINALKLFLDHDKELAIKDFAHFLNLPKPTIHSIVNTLTVHDILEQNPDNAKYRLGPVAFRLGLQFVRQKELFSFMGVWMERLCYKFNKSVNVCMLIGNKVVVVFKVDPEDTITSYPNLGGEIPLYNTAGGKILLAFSDETTRSMVFSSNTSEKTPDKPDLDINEFQNELLAVKKSGVGYDRDESIMGVSAIAGPILNHNGQIVASFSISGKTGFFIKNQKRIAAEIMKTSMAISKQLGFKGRYHAR